MEYTFTQEGWDDFMYWQTQDKKTLKRIHDLIKDVARNGNTGIGHPEPLKDASGCWSRRINEKDRFIYKIDGQMIKIIQCRSHYGDH